MVDGYTKAVLTIIAVALVAIAVQGPRTITPAQAQSGAVHVVVDSVASYALQFAGPIQIRQ
jgi:hypothetical protein